MATEKPLPDMPAQVDKPKRTEKLHAAYKPATGNKDHVEDFAVFGVKVDALEFAMGQDPVWKVTPILKGQTLTDAIKAAR